MIGATPDGRRIVEAARRWIGTPFVHRHRIRNRGIDCIGLIKEVGVETCLLPLGPGAGAPFRHYSRLPDPRMMTEALRAFLEPLNNDPKNPRPGAVALIEWQAGAMIHAGIIGEHNGRPTLIHVLEAGGRGCVEHGFTGHWSARVASFWRYPLAGL